MVFVVLVLNFKTARDQKSRLIKKVVKRKTEGEMVVNEIFFGAFRKCCD